jgi:hypothetical protein
MDPFYMVLIFMMGVLVVISFTTDCYASKEQIMNAIYGKLKRMMTYIVDV